MSNKSKCPQCGAPLTENAPAGLCPNCLMALNLKTETMVSDDAPATQPPLPPEKIAPHFPQLEILECLGRGGMGVVYKARQKTLNRFVALKLLAPERADDALFAARFTREAQALAALNHPNIVTIHDFGQAGGFYFLLMEFVDGVNLRQLLRARKFTPEEALAIVPTLCDALQFAHERGIVHRDIKPENLLLDKSGRVKIADFGIAKMLGHAVGSAPDGSPDEGATQNAVGTRGYSAPEQQSAPQHVDSRADIYSLGVVFYEMLTGELPGKTIEPPSRKVQIDVRLDAVVLRALEKTPELRWQTASDLRTQVETIAGTVAPPVSSQPAGAHHVGAMRWRILIWGAALTVAGASMNLAFGIFGAGMFVAALALALAGNLKMSVLACRLVSIQGAVMAAAAIWFAFASDLATPWLVAIVAGCLLGIGYCVSCWVKLNALNREPGCAAFAWRPWLKKNLLIRLPVLLVILVIIRTFFLEPFRAATDSAAPEIPRGSQFLVWKLSHHFVIGDLIAYRLDGWPLLGRVVRNDEGVICVNRNDKVGHLQIVPPQDIIGKVVSIYWRASNSAWLRASTDGQPGLFKTTGSRVEAHAVSLAALLSYAYGSPKLYIHWSENRVILPSGVTGGKFDFTLTDCKNPQAVLRTEIEKQLGLVAHRELREADVLELFVSDPAVIAQFETRGGNGSDSGAAPGLTHYEFANMPIETMSDFLEVSLGTPVINRTELTQKYSGSLKWDPQADKPAELKEVHDILAGKFGLELVPRRESIEMLVVEKSR